VARSPATIVRSPLSGSIRNSGMRAKISGARSR
jgi:hypothetical protein